MPRLTPHTPRQIASIKALIEWQRVRRRSLAERFWEKVQKTDTCWLWTGASNHLGYGQLASGDGSQRLTRATKVAWELLRGPIPDGLHLCHHCDNPPCVNPDHLFLGTAKDNMRDAIAKGRFKFPTPRRGEANNKARLTWALAREVRRAYAAGETLSQLSRRLGMARASLRSVVSAKTWHEPGVTKIEGRQMTHDEHKASAARALKARWDKYRQRKSQ